MGQYDGFEFEDQNGGQGNESGSDLRKARDEAARKARELESQVAQLQKQLTERNLKDVLQAKNLNPGLAKWMSVDGVDGSDESKVDEWLTSNAALIGYKPEAPEEPADDGRADAFAKFANAQSNALPAGKLSEIQAGIEKAEGFEQMNAELARLRGTISN